MATDDPNDKRGYSSDKYSTQSREYFDNERRKEAEFWNQQEQNRAKSERMKAEHEKKMQEIRGRQEAARVAVAGRKFQELPKQSPSQRLGGGKNVGTQRGGGASSSSTASNHLGKGQNVGAQREFEATPKQPVAVTSPGKTNAGWDIDEKDAPPQKLGGVFFWMTGGLATVQDFVVDPATDGLIAFGLGGSAVTVGIGAVIGVPIAALAWVAKIGFLVTIWLIMWVYFYLHGGIHVTVKLKRFVIWGISFFTSWIPGLALLPAVTFAFFLVAILENLVRKDNLIGYAVRKAVNTRETYLYRKRSGGISPRKEIYEIA